MQNKSGKTAVFSRDATLWNVKEVPSSALDKMKIPETSGECFRGFLYVFYEERQRSCHHRLSEFYSF